MVNWIAGRWSEPWRCMVNHAGIFDTRPFAWSADIPSYVEAQFGDWTRPEDFERFNPALHIENWRVRMGGRADRASRFPGRESLDP
jgi:dipeptidyl aminopeptidase/acylaminoacyl peptidase